MFHAMWEFTQSENPQIAYVILAQWSAMVSPNYMYYTELVDHYSSSSDQLAMARIYAGVSNCKLYTVNPVIYAVILFMRNMRVVVRAHK